MVVIRGCGRGNGDWLFRGISFSFARCEPSEDWLYKDVNRLTTELGA